jgi:hypothetical protein
LIDAQAILYQRLSGDITVTSLMGGYGAGAAIFSVPVPHNFVVGVEPSTLIDYPLGSEDDDSYTEFYRVVDIRVRLYGKPDPSVGGTAALNRAAEAVRDSIKNWPRSAVAGGVMISATVSGPVDAPTTDPTNAGRLLNVRLKLKEV